MKKVALNWFYKKLFMVSNSGKNLSRTIGIAIILVIFPYHHANTQDLDVPYVSTPPYVVEKMLDIANVGPGDYVIDLGSGDGRIVIAAAERGAYGHGVDLNPQRIKEAKINAREANVSDKVMFIKENIFHTDLGRANVITMYLLSSVNLELRPRLLDSLEPGTKIVSHNFDMGNWEPDTHIKLGSSPRINLENELIEEPIKNNTYNFNLEIPIIEDPIKIDNYDINPGNQEIQDPVKINNHDVYCWVIPAKVEGTWQWRTNGKEFIMKAEQQYQEIQLTVYSENVLLKILSSDLVGKRISFTAMDPSNGNKYVYNGRVDENKIIGKIQIRSPDYKSIENWSATQK